MDDEDGYFGERVAATYDESAEIFEPGAASTLPSRSGTCGPLNWT
jgi:hypothetical protein